MCPELTVAVTVGECYRGPTLGTTSVTWLCRSGSLDSSFGEALDVCLCHSQRGRSGWRGKTGGDVFPIFVETALVHKVLVGAGTTDVGPPGFCSWST